MFFPKGFLRFAAKKSFSPINIPNLEVWLAADLGSPSSSLWSDQSGNGHNATPATANLSTLETNVQNGLPGMRFGDLTLDSSMTLGDLSSVFPTSATAFVVCKTLGNSYNFFDTSANDSYFCFSAGNGYTGVFRTTRIETYPPSSFSANAQIFEFYSNSSAFSVTINGVDKGTQAAQYNAGNNYRIAPSYALGTAATIGYIFEVILYNRILTSDEKNQIREYVSGKWNISI